MAGRSYPTSEVRGCSREELPCVLGQGQQLRATGCHSTGAAERSYPTSEVRGSGRERQDATAQEQPRGATFARGQGRRLGGATPRPRSSGCAGAAGLEELFHVKVRRGGSEEIPLVQGKEQQLRFAGTAVKRYPTPKVRETQVRQVLQEGKDGRHTETIRGPQLWLYLAPRLLN